MLNARTWVQVQNVFSRLQRFTTYCIKVSRWNFNSNCTELLLLPAEAMQHFPKYRNIRPEGTSRIMWLSHSHRCLCNFLPSVAENGGETEPVSLLQRQTWRARLQDQHKPFKGQEHYILWRGSGKADVTVFTTFTTPSGEVLPFSRLLFVRNITPKISRHERDHLLEKG